MADKASVTKGSDVLVDVCCSTCQDEEIHTEAKIYCQLCTKFYCGQCLILHSQLFKKHTTYDKGEQFNWPVSKATEDFLEKCEVHGDKKIELFCDDHGQLCCVTCVLLNHRQCTKVTIIADSVKNRPNVNLQEILAKINYILKQLTNIQNTQKSYSQSLQDNYNDRLQEIRDMRNEINLALDKLENATLTEMDTLMNQLKESLKADADICTKIHDELKQLSDIVPVVENKSSHLAFVAYQKSLGKLKESERCIKYNFAQTKFMLKFHGNTEIVQYFSKLSGLGSLEHNVPLLIGEMNPDRKIDISGKRTDLSINVPGVDENKCDIRSICCLLDGQIVLFDSANHRMKLLDQMYRLVSHCAVPRVIHDICHVDSYQLASVHSSKGMHKIQMFTVGTGKLVMGMNYQLTHSCYGIAHHQGILFISSDNALYQYTMTGTLVRKLYEDTTNNHLDQVKCAVGLGGDKLYITIPLTHKLLTLSMDGTVLSTFTDPELQIPRGVHVTPSGQVLVCGCSSSTLIQVDGEGKTKIATLVTQKDGLIHPLSVSSKQNDAIIVAQWQNSIMLLFEVK